MSSQRAPADQRIRNNELDAAFLSELENKNSRTENGILGY